MQNGQYNVQVSVVDTSGQSTSQALSAVVLAHNSLATAVNIGPLTAGQTVIGTGTIGYATDVNYYQFSVSTTGQVDLETYAQQINSPLDTKLTLLDASGNVITTNDDAVGTDSRIITTLAAGTYFAEVQGSNNTLGYYEVHFTALAAPVPQIVGMTPSQTIGVTPNPLVIQLSLDNGAINPATVTPTAFNLTILGPGNAPLAGVSGQISATSYDAATNTINVTIVALDSSSQPLANLPSGIYELTVKGTGPNAITSTTGVALAGGDYTGSFTVVAQPPVATLAVYRRGGRKCPGRAVPILGQHQPGLSGHVRWAGPPSISIRRATACSRTVR